MAPPPLGCPELLSVGGGPARASQVAVLGDGCCLYWRKVKTLNEHFPEGELKQGQLQNILSWG